MTTVVRLLMFSSLLLTMAQAQAQDILLDFEISEQFPPDTFVADILEKSGLKTSLTTAQLGQLQFMLLTEGNDHAPYFIIGEQDGILRTREEIDRDSKVFCPKQVLCSVALRIIAQGPPGLFQVIRVTVEILDQNDEDPIFLEDPAERSIPENTKVGTSFSIPSAQDLDSPQHGINEYKILSGDVATFQLVVVDNSELYLVLRQPVDREQEDLYQFVITAIDTGPQPNSGTLNLDVVILDVNDNPPAFERPTYSLTIPETFEPRTVMLTVTANDQDSGANGEIVYGFSSQTELDYGELFAIAQTTGQISLKDYLDYETQEVYSLVVTAREKSVESLPTEAKVTVKVSDINDNAPETTVNALSPSGRVEIKENAVPGEVAIAYISVEDPDTGFGSQFDCSLSTADFSLQGGTADFRLFSTVGFDHEDSSSVDVDLVCEDQGVPRKTSTTTIEVHILDENDNTPQFEFDSYSVEILENSPEGTELIQLSATDDDSNGNGQVIYQLVSDLNDYVSLDPITGNLTARKSFDRESLETIQLLVEASDQGSPSRHSSVIVTFDILDVNDEAPEFIQSQYSFNVSENATALSFVGQISAWDADLFPNNEFEFTFPNGLQSTDKFAIDNNSGTITTRVILDREVQDVYHLEILAVDKHNQDLRSSVPVVIHVIDVNDHHPVISFPGQYNNTVHIPNDLEVGDTVATIEATDADVGDNADFVYSIHTGNEAAVFRIDSTRGIIQVNRELNTYDEQLFLLQIRVQDKGSPPKAVESVLNIVVNKSLSRDGASSNGSTSDQNLTIVICVALVSVVIMLILVVAIVMVCRQEKYQKRKNYMTELLKDSGLCDSRGSAGVGSDCSSSDGSSIKKEVSFSNDVQMVDEIPYMQKTEHWAPNEPQSSTSTSKSRYPATISPTPGQQYHHTVFPTMGVSSIGSSSPRARHYPTPSHEGQDEETTSIQSNTDSGRGSHEECCPPVPPREPRHPHSSVESASRGVNNYLSPGTHMSHTRERVVPARQPPSSCHDNQTFLRLQEEGSYHGSDDVFYLNPTPSVV